MAFKVIVAGDRNFTDYEFVKEKLDFYLKDKTDIEIVSGKARGVDTLGENYAKEKGYPIAEFPADWNKYKLAAGPIRNGQMADYADACIAFLASHSRGTKDMIRQAKKKGLSLRVINI